jgi:hypothetical protein
MLADALREARQLKLVSEKDGQILLDEAFGALLAKQGLDRSMLDHLERMILDSRHNETTGQAEVALAIAWVLEGDPTQPRTFSYILGEDIASDLGDDTKGFGLRGDAARTQQLYYWGLYLGLIVRMRGAGSGAEALYAVPEPSRAIRRHLPAVFGKHERLASANFVKGLGSLCPVLEAGDVRENVLAMMPENQRRPADRLSRSTSLGLLRLREEGVLSTVGQSDAHMISLDPGPGLRTEDVAHFKRGERFDAGTQ